jgi:hypothetical protein
MGLIIACVIYPFPGLGNVGMPILVLYMHMNRYRFADTRGTVSTFTLLNYSFLYCTADGDYFFYIYQESRSK